MKLENLVGERFRERPSDCALDSHALMIRGGYMKHVANGIYSSFMPLRRITRKIEGIIREEMDAIGGQEVQFPVVLPASLWMESGRYASVGRELARFKDRNDSPLVLGMTHEEAAVHLVREYAQSHAKYPFMIYQIQTKFRDEARPRGGLIRVREFTMKDAYSFHTSQEDLERYYQRCFRAYERIFARVGIPEVIAVSSDSGMMGGDLSHEFMLLTPVGEDSIAICPKCGYRANVEAAACVVRNDREEAGGELTPVHTPGCHSIADVCAFLGVPASRSCKTVVYQKNRTGEYVVLFIRGDLDANETKLANFLGEEIHQADITPECGLCAGYIGPYGLGGNHTLLFDRSLEHARGLCCGANREGYHYIGLDVARDLGAPGYFDFAKIAQGFACPACGQSAIRISRGIEVGNIFQLGTKYARAMNLQYLDDKGAYRHPVMGCYGIGVGRLAASVCEARRDEYGPIWPISIAPWQVHLCCVRADREEVKQRADSLYEALLRNGVEVVYDDRRVSAGVMFSDADLIGVPVRAIVSPRGIGGGRVEICTRDKSVSMEVPFDGALDEIMKMIARMTDLCRAAD